MERINQSIACVSFDRQKKSGEGVSDAMFFGAATLECDCVILSGDRHWEIKR
jgi:hypothetical protein